MRLLDLKTYGNQQLHKKILLIRRNKTITFSQHAAFKLRQETAKYIEEDNDMITAARKIAQKFQQMAKYTK